MSRNIADKTSPTISQDDRILRNTSDGKLLFTEYMQEKCAMLLRDGKLISASFLSALEGKIGAVYIGKVKNVARNIDACFVEIADKELCFLPLKDANFPFLLNRSFDGRILEGDELPVQIVRDAQKKKQASVTAKISLANDYFVLESGAERVSYSSKLAQETRTKLAKQLTENGVLVKNRLAPELFPFEMPFSILFRTKAEELCGTDELIQQLKKMVDEFSSLIQKARYLNCFSCLLKAPGPYEQVIRQLAAPGEFQEIVTDNEEQYQELCAYAQEHMPEKNVRLYSDANFSLESIYSLKSKMEVALSERVWLKSGGNLIIQPTDAMTVIDVNSGKYEAKKGSEETALKINLEAAEEIALQLRLRNLSGIIIVDFINMREETSREKLMNFLKTAVRRDRILTVVVDMTALGLVEITRKKENKSLREQVQNK